MARITLNGGLRMSDFLTGTGFVSPFVPTTRVTVLDNVGFTSAQGIVYQDLVRATFTVGSPAARDSWAGSGLAFNTTTRTFSAGTLNALIGEYAPSGSYVQAYAIEGLSVGAVSFSRALFSNGPQSTISALFAGADSLRGSGSSDSWNGLGGNDSLAGNGGNDTLTGGLGNDTLDGGTGNDSLDGGTGADLTRGGSGNDLYKVDSSADRIVELSGGGTDTVVATATTTLAPWVDHLTLAGTTGIGGTGNGLANTLTGNAGSNTLRGLIGADRLVGNAGNDTLDGGTGNDSLYGGTGNDTYLLDTAADFVSENTNAGTDTVRSSVAHTLKTHFEHLVLTGTGNTAGTGNTVANMLTGNTGANLLRGDAGNDTIAGGSGNDTLVGGTDDDRLTGGLGADAFRFDTPAIPFQAGDTITDFLPADDRIELVQATFAGFGPLGVLTAEAFALGTAAAEADDRILYDAATGAIRIDRDGTGTQDAVIFARVAPGTALTADDFFIV
jgi:Ca2+-binding RTX toxin-like protein